MKKTEYLMRLEDNQWHYIAVPGFCVTCHPDKDKHPQRNSLFSCTVRQEPWINPLKDST